MRKSVTLCLLLAACSDAFASEMIPYSAWVRKSTDGGSILVPEEVINADANYMIDDKLRDRGTNFMPHDGKIITFRLFNVDFIGRPFDYLKKYYEANIGVASYKRDRDRLGVLGFEGKTVVFAACRSAPKDMLVCFNVEYEKLAKASIDRKRPTRGVRGLRSSRA